MMPDEPADREMLYRRHMEKTIQLMNSRNEYRRQAEYYNAEYERSGDEGHLKEARMLMEMAKLTEKAARNERKRGERNFFVENNEGLPPGVVDLRRLSDWSAVKIAQEQYKLALLESTFLKLKLITGEALTERLLRNMRQNNVPCDIPGPSHSYLVIDLETARGVGPTGLARVLRLAPSAHVHMVASWQDMGHTD
eukprot:CAMPEP_0170182148 /NCGR_PEP_ID=MMETSP0040_2-20121228/27046_1 /TAXON_ID=641309 /ORGANISM="Lotharella oceanica, Strain CCMP622" /LENGTH=194 /DNA_ID=CAMNT_0010427457 /DNA_START=67 /DNA_END=652 /DNA_ORIENTATION=+